MLPGEEVVPVEEALTAEEVLVAMNAYLGRELTAAEPLGGYIFNQNFMLRSKQGDLVLKAAAERELLAEAWACRKVQGLGVPVPEVVAVEAGRGVLSRPFVLLRELPGAELATGRHPALVGAGRALRLVHTQRIEGYGPLAGPWESPRGLHRTWAEFVLAPLGKGLDQLVAGGVVGEDLADRIRSMVQRFRALVAYDGTGVLLHGDLKPRHVFADGDRLTGIIDWGDAASGDPMCDLARFSIAGPESLAPLLEGYDLALTPDLEAKFAAYRVIWSVRALHGEFVAGGDWFDAYRSTITAGLAELPVE